MKNTVLFISLVLFSTSGFSQDTLQAPFSFVEIMPIYQGGETAMYEFLKSKIIYPKIEREKHIQGTVFVNFVIEADGTPTRFKVERGVPGGSGLDSAAINACMALNKFSPGIRRGVPVPVSITIPVKFTLDKSLNGLSKREIRRINKDGRDICKLLYEITEAQKIGDKKKTNNLKADFVMKVKSIEKDYPALSMNKAKLSLIIQPCLDEAHKIELEK
jgi:TonB family protein